MPRDNENNCICLVTAARVWNTKGGIESQLVISEFGILIFVFVNIMKHIEFRIAAV